MCDIALHSVPKLVTTIRSGHRDDGFIKTLTDVVTAERYRFSDGAELVLLKRDWKKLEKKMATLYMGNQRCRRK